MQSPIVGSTAHSPWQNKPLHPSLRFWLTFIAAMLIMTIFICLLIVGMFLYTVFFDPTDDILEGVKIVLISILALAGSVICMVPILRALRRPVPIKISYMPVDATVIGFPFDVKFTRGIWGRSLSGNGSLRFEPNGLHVIGKMEPHSLLTISIVLIVTVLPYIFFGIGLGVIPALWLGYNIGRSNIDLVLPYESLGKPKLAGLNFTAQRAEAPHTIKLQVSHLDGERLYREVRQRYPHLVSNWE